MYIFILAAAFLLHLTCCNSIVHSAKFFHYPFTHKLPAVKAARAAAVATPFALLLIQCCKYLQTYYQLPVWSRETRVSRHGFGTVLTLVLCVVSALSSFRVSHLEAVFLLVKAKWLFYIETLSESRLPGPLTCCLFTYCRLQCVLITALLQCLCQAF